MLARQRCGDSDLGVRVVRGTDIDDIDIRAINYIAPVRSVFRESISLCCVLCQLLIDIYNHLSFNFYRRTEKNWNDCSSNGVGFAHEASPDQRDIVFFHDPYSVGPTCAS
ncbi:hypothetical protein D3C81_1812560 [compost metagenome]